MQSINQEVKNRMDLDFLELDKSQQIQVVLITLHYQVLKYMDKLVVLVGIFDCMSIISKYYIKFIANDKS